MDYKIIKTEEEYEIALQRMEEIFDAAENSPEENELELLGLLIEKYEDEHYKIELPDPIEAIKFCMEQQGLTRKDLAKYIGSMSKVSEVLNYKRSLSLAMIRALHEGLGIPAEVLLNKPGEHLKSQKYQIVDFPFKEMYKRGYLNFDGKLNAAKEQSEELLNKFFTPVEHQGYELCARQSENGVAEVNALKAWQVQILHIVEQEKLEKFHSDCLTDKFFDRVSRLSYFEHGPSLVKEALNKVGIHFVVLEHLPKTHLDGACFFSTTGNPVIAMTLRHDRLDNFWFTLFHELGHLKLGHISPTDNKVYMDDTFKSRKEVNQKENEADAFAREQLISSDLWEKNRNSILEISTVHQLVELAEELEINPVILAGRIRWETKDYTKFIKLIGYGMVKKLFVS